MKTQNFVNSEKPNFFVVRSPEKDDKGNVLNATDEIPINIDKTLYAFGTSLSDAIQL